MSALFKAFLAVTIIATIGSMLIGIIPQPFTSSVNGSIVYFLSSLSVFGFIVNVNTIFICMTIILNTILGFISFVFIFYIGHFFMQ
jgi:hypothetical protein